MPYRPAGGTAASAAHTTNKVTIRRGNTRPSLVQNPTRSSTPSQKLSFGTLGQGVTAPSGAKTGSHRVHSICLRSVDAYAMCTAAPRAWVRAAGAHERGLGGGVCSVTHGLHPAIHSAGQSMTVLCVGRLPPALLTGPFHLPCHTQYHHQSCRHTCCPRHPARQGRGNDAA